MKSDLFQRLAAWRQHLHAYPELSCQERATAAFDCTISQVVEVGTHSVIFCAVRAIHLGGTASGLIYHGRTYHKVGQEKG